MALAIFGLALLLTTSWATAQETVLHSFSGNPSDGAQPLAGLIFDAAGNLYGTTAYGGPNNEGTVFELSPQQGGGWTETVLHSFGPNDGSDGINPSDNLIFDGAGNLYGTTQEGGTYSDGTVFELSPRQGGGWTETVLYSLTGPGLGRQPLRHNRRGRRLSLQGERLRDGV
jgi:uncharacterized repeat protein (TIGR03803 family)